MTKLTAAILVFCGMLVIWAVGIEVVEARLLIDVAGTIVASQDFPSRGRYRYSTDYAIQSVDGRQIYYTAGPTDASLERSLPVGTEVRKLRWQLGYEIDGRWIAFPLLFYGATLAAASLATIVGAINCMSWREDPMA